MTAPRRLTIVVELDADGGPPVTARAEDVAQGIVDDARIRGRLCAAQWGDMMPEADGEQGCAHCIAERGPCWIHAR